MAPSSEQVTGSGDALARAEAIRARSETVDRIRAHRRDRVLRETQGRRESQGRREGQGRRESQGRRAPATPPPTGRRPVALRANRVMNAGLGVCGFLVVVVLAYGVYRTAMQSVASGSVVIGVAGITLVGMARRLGPGRLLVLKVGADVTVTNSWQPEVVIDRAAEVRALLWVRARYKGAAPTARGLFLIADGGVRSSSRPYTFTPERLRRFLAATGIPLEVVDAPDASTALAAGASRPR